MEVYFKT